MRFVVFRRVRTFCAIALTMMFALPGTGFANSITAEMVGQMILIGFKGDSVQQVKPIRDLIHQQRIGGVLYLKNNIKSQADVREMNAAFRAANPLMLPFISIDQEGGVIERLTRAVDFKEVPSAADIAKGDIATARKLYVEMAASLKEIGFNLNFGPVVDVNVNPNNPIIAKYGRSYSSDPTTVSAFALEFIRAHQDAGLITALKHFPGHGSSTADTHLGFADITDTWQESRELQPYKDLFALGYSDMVMTGHLFKKLGIRDKTANVPASLSQRWVDSFLRDKLHFKGLVITDDLNMGAIQKHFGLKDAVRRAIDAGTDILLFSASEKDPRALTDELIDHILFLAEDPFYEIRIKESYDRIVALKQSLN